MNSYLLFCASGIQSNKYSGCREDRRILFVIIEKPPTVRPSRNVYPLISVKLRSDVRFCSIAENYAYFCSSYCDIKYFAFAKNSKVHEFHIRQLLFAGAKSVAFNSKNSESRIHRNFFSFLLRQRTRDKRGEVYISPKTFPENLSHSSLL